MTSTLHPLHTLGELDAVLAASHQRPVVIFKHSASCGTSAEAYDEMLDLVAGPLPADVYLVDVWDGRQVSDEAARRLGVRHQSPQALIVSDGLVVWQASHFRVTAGAVRDALAHFSSAR